MPAQTLTTKHCWMQQEDLFVPKHGCCGCWKSPARWSKDHPWTTPSQESRASLYSGAQTNAKFVSTKVNVGAYSLHLLPMERLELLLPCKVPNKMIHTDCVIKCAGACGGIVLKCPHQIVTCELIILALCCACSQQIYQFPAGNGQQKQTYKIWTPSVQKKLVAKSLCFPAVAIYCNVHQVYVGECGPGEALHVDVDLTTVHTLVRVWVHLSK
jgi:hypothetical protein